MTAILVAAAVQAAVSQVTVFGDRARVERTCTVALDGNTRVELPLLPDAVDPDSIRLATSGGELQRIDVQHVDPDDFPVGEARELLTQIDRADDRLQLAGSERDALRQQISALGRIAPKVQDEDPLRPRPRLNPKGWSEALAFTQAEGDRLRARARDVEQRVLDLRDERERLAEKGRLLGGTARRSGFRVLAFLAGKGKAELTLTYTAMKARWTPEYTLQLGSDQKTLRVGFGGAASQESGEDWSDAILTLSTAVPATARALPEIATWKIGERERFIPTPVRANRVAPPQPPPVPLPLERPEGEVERLRRRLETTTRGGVTGEFKGLVVGGQAGAKPAAPPAQAPAMSKEQMNLVPYGRPERGNDPRPAVVARSAPASSSVPAMMAEPVEREGGLNPPLGFQLPPLPPDAPNALAGGYDLEFPSKHRETLKTGAGARRVALFTETWPVTTERHLFPALSPDAIVVAQLKNPSKRTFPRGRAQLLVGDDPAGTALVPLMAPGEEATVPLGIDRALRPFRNVAQLQAERGVFSKDEVTRYEVTIEVANPHPAPVAMKIFDQLPQAGDKNARIEDVDLRGAALEAGTGKLTWSLTAPAKGKSVVKFAYTLRRPKGAKVHQ